MINATEVIDNFKAGRFEIDCKRMVILQNKADGSRFEGQGYIRQNAEGILIFKMYVEKWQIADRMKFLEQVFENRSGKIYEDDSYYDLVVTDRKGTEWSAGRIIASIKTGLSDDPPLVSGNLGSLRAEELVSQAYSSIRLHFFNRYEIPLNKMGENEVHGERWIVRDRDEFDGQEGRFSVRRYDDDTVIEVQSDSKFGSDFDLRIQEALQFITAKPAFWRARVQADNERAVIELASPTRRPPRTQFGPPIDPHSTGFYECGWKLFSCFLGYVQSKTNGTYWNPMAYHLYNACEATANSMDAWAVGYSVAVEALASLLTLGEREEKQTQNRAIQTILKECIRGNAELAKHQERLGSLIGMLGQESVKDKLYNLAEQGYVEKQYINSWSELRNRCVHPKIKDLKKADSAATQSLLNLLHEVETLMRQIVYYLIEYNGPFTDYGAPGFPLKAYPLIATESSGSGIAV